MDAVLGKIRRSLLHRGLFVDFGRGPEDSILLSSMGRSGSTFASNVINFDSSYRQIFEPFKPDSVGIVNQFIYPYYIAPEMENAELHRAATKILSGKLRNQWSDKFNTALVARKRLVKDIRTNFMLAWLQKNFPAMPIVLLIRHPLATVKSWIQSGFGHADFMRQRLLDQQHFARRYLRGNEDEFRVLKSDPEILSFCWCLHYSVPIAELSAGKYHVAFYENFIIEPEAETRRLLDFLGRKWAPAVMDSLSIPSKTSRDNSPIVRGAANINEWREYFSSQTIKKCNSILQSFGFDDLYDDNSHPNRSALKQLKP